MLEKAKRALRITTDAFDDEINDLVDAAIADLGIAGVQTDNTLDPLIIRAALTYVRANFGQPENYDKLKAAYDEQKAQLQTASGYTDWGDDVG